jgi:hypothetical protein
MPPASTPRPSPQLAEKIQVSPYRIPEPVPVPVLVLVLVPAVAPVLVLTSTELECMLRKEARLVDS